MLEVTYHQSVQEELTQYAVYYEEQSEGLGDNTATTGHYKRVRLKLVSGPVRL